MARKRRIPVEFIKQIVIEVVKAALHHWWK